uniref:Uncharacterized protein n=1 Tax=Glossina austeni TaxID=7395 RepID=A0A1A9UUK6_GLOAU
MAAPTHCNLLNGNTNVLHSVKWQHQPVVPVSIYLNAREYICIIRRISIIIIVTVIVIIKHKDSNRKKNISLSGPSCSKAIQNIAFNEQEFGPILRHTTGGAAMAAYDHNDPVLCPQPN